MIKKLIGRVLSGKLFNPRSQSGAITLEFKSHSVSREQISACALQVTDTLQSKGFSAYVVGGAVRDLLLKRTPKDYDVATNAFLTKASCTRSAKRVRANSAKALKG